MLNEYVTSTIPSTIHNTFNGSLPVCVSASVYCVQWWRWLHAKISFQVRARCPYVQYIWLCFIYISTFLLALFSPFLSPSVVSYQLDSWCSTCRFESRRASTVKRYFIPTSKHFLKWVRWIADSHHVKLCDFRKDIYKHRKMTEKGVKWCTQQEKKASRRAPRYTTLLLRLYIYLFGFQLYGFRFFFALLPPPFTFA